MLQFLDQSRRASERKLRLFSCACVRAIWHLLQEEESKQAIEAGEQYVEGLIGQKALTAARRAAFAAWKRYKRPRFAVSGKVTNEVEVRRELAAYYPQGTSPHTTPEHQARLLRDIFGLQPLSPLPPIAPEWLQFSNGIIPKLAATIYEDRALPAGTFDPERMVILGDALEEAGCGDQVVLEHCRQPGAIHVRGCWVVDALLKNG
jgi:hypothetical protein